MTLKNSMLLTPQMHHAHSNRRCPVIEVCSYRSVLSILQIKPHFCRDQTTAGFTLTHKINTQGPPKEQFLHCPNYLFFLSLIFFKQDIRKIWSFFEMLWIYKQYSKVGQKFAWWCIFMQIIRNLLSSNKLILTVLYLY